MEGGPPYVFVSYSRADQAYVDQLVEHLTERGITPWIDRHTDYGERWLTVIRQRVDGCAAMVVVQTPAAEHSPWVEREILRAEGLEKPIVPLLLDGPPFFMLGTLQHENVRGGVMPGDRFVSRLLRIVAPQPTSDTPPPDEDVPVPTEPPRAKPGRVDPLSAAAAAAEWVADVARRADKLAQLGQLSQAEEAMRQYINTPEPEPSKAAKAMAQYLSDAPAAAPSGAALGVEPAKPERSENPADGGVFGLGDLQVVGALGDLRIAKSLGAELGSPLALIPHEATSAKALKEVSWRKPVLLLCSKASMTSKWAPTLVATCEYLIAADLDGFLHRTLHQWDAQRFVQFTELIHMRSPDDRISRAKALDRIYSALANINRLIAGELQRGGWQRPSTPTSVATSTTDDPFLDVLRAAVGREAPASDQVGPAVERKEPRPSSAQEVMAELAHRPYMMDEWVRLRNEPCHCGSGQRFRDCHGREAAQ